MKKISGKQYKLGLQIVFWTLYILIFILSEYLLFDQFGESSMKVAMVGRFLFDAAVFYLHYKYLSPLFLPLRKYVLYVSSIVFIIILNIVIEYFSYNLYLKAEIISIPLRNRLFVETLIVETLTTCILLISSGAMQFSEQWVDIKEKERVLEKNNLKLKSDLKFLKTQINPHFLFNTLNSVYYLSHKKSPKAAQMVENLSKIMRHLMYDGSLDEVQLIKEVRLIEDYIKLYSTRFDEHHNIDFYYENILMEHKIAPLILISFIENAIKHSNILNSAEAWVKIELIVEKNILNFAIINSKPACEVKVVSNNIGNRNIMKQLGYIYPNTHNLKINNDKTSYNVNLKLEL